MGRLSLVFLAACGPIATAPPPRPAPEPGVDMACVQRMRSGKVELPAQVGSFTVTAADHGAHMHRDGRTLDDDEGKRFWDVFQHEVFNTGMSGASYGMYSIYTCTDADKRNCIKLELWLCQSDLNAFANRLAAALQRAGANDAAMSVDLTFEEPRGPSCRRGAACEPQPHYSTKDGEYRFRQTRSIVDHGRGSCSNDGDCEPSGQSCVAWYLAGGISTAEYRQYKRPTFCGCVEQRCHFFQQP